MKFEATVCDVCGDVNEIMANITITIDKGDGYQTKTKEYTMCCNCINAIIGEIEDKREVVKQNLIEVASLINGNSSQKLELELGPKYSYGTNIIEIINRVGNTDVDIDEFIAEVAEVLPLSDKNMIRYDGSNYQKRKDFNYLMRTLGVPYKLVGNRDNNMCKIGKVE